MHHNTHSVAHHLRHLTQNWLCTKIKKFRVKVHSLQCMVKMEENHGNKTVKAQN